MALRPLLLLVLALSLLSFCGAQESEDKPAVETANGDPLQPDGKNPVDSVCDPTIQESPPWVVYVVGVVLILVGLAFCFAGWRVFPVVVGLMGFFIGFCVGYYGVAYIILVSVSETVTWHFWVSLACGVVLGALGASCAVCCINLAYFIVGAFVGVMLGVFLSHIVSQFVVNYPIWAVWCWVVGLGVAFAFVGLCVGKYFVMLGTAFGGAQEIMFGIAIMLEKSMIAPSDCHKELDPNSSTWTIVYFVLIAVLTIAGFCVQYKFFSEHENEKYNRVPQSAV